MAIGLAFSGPAVGEGLTQSGTVPRGKGQRLSRGSGQGGWWRTQVSIGSHGVAPVFRRGAQFSRI